MFPYFIQGVVIGLSASATPGPFLAFLLAQTLQRGFKRTLPATLAPLISDGPIIALVLLILNQTSAEFLHIIRFIGGFFLLYLAYEAWLARQKEVAIATLTPEPLAKTVFKGAMMNALSPGPYLFWSLIAGPIVLTGWREAPSWGLSFVAGFYLTLIGGFMAFVGLFALTSRLDPRLSQWLGTASAVALFCFGLYQLSQGVWGIN